MEIGVDDAGFLAARRTGDVGESPEHHLRCVFAAPWLITFRSDTMWITYLARFRAREHIPSFLGPYPLEPGPATSG